MTVYRDRYLDHRGRILVADGGEPGTGEDGTGEDGTGEDGTGEDGEEEQPEDGEDGEEEDGESGQPEGVDRGDRPAINALAVEDELVRVEGFQEAREGVVINDIEVPGATSVKFAGEGYESQYLREVGGGGSDQPYGPNATPQDGSGGSGEDSESGDSEGEEPPLHITVEGYMSQPTAEEFVSLRDLDDTFTVSINGTEYDEMELTDFTRTLAAESPYAYSVSIEVVEFREIEVDTEGFPYGPGASPGGGGGQSGSGSEQGDPAEDAEELESGTPDDPRVVSLEPGEQREFRVDSGETANNVIFDTSDGSGAMVYPRGEDWTVRDMGWRGEENRSGIAARGSGRILNIYLGHSGDSGVIVEDGQRVEVSQLNIQNSTNGLHVVEGGVGNLAFK